MKVKNAKEIGLDECLSLISEAKQNLPSELLATLNHLSTEYLRTSDTYRREVDFNELCLMVGLVNKVSQIGNNLVTKVEVPLKECIYCKEVMFEIDTDTLYRTLKKNALKCGYVTSSKHNHKHNSKYCTTCEKRGARKILCELCKEMVPISDVIFEIGDYSPDFLCKGCYGSIPAKRWDEAIDALENSHKWDYT